MLATAPPDEAQRKDVDFSRGSFAPPPLQPILENARTHGADPASTRFEVPVRDFSRHAAVELHGAVRATSSRCARAVDDPQAGRYAVPIGRVQDGSRSATRTDEW
jgi:hypothetical protein